MKTNLNNKVKKISLLVIVAGVIGACNGGATNNTKSVQTKTGATIEKTLSLSAYKTVTARNPNGLPDINEKDNQYISQWDKDYVAALRQKIESATISNGQGGGGNVGNWKTGVLSWQVPTILGILMDAERSFYGRNAASLMDRIVFNNSPNFDMSQPRYNVHSVTNNMQEQLAWEERICGDKGCHFNGIRNELTLDGGSANLLNFDSFSQKIAERFSNQSAMTGKLGMGAVINDDRQWWALELLHIYELNPASHPDLLVRVKELRDITAKYTQSNGAICWSMNGKYDTGGGCYENSVTNELYMVLNAKLAQLVGPEDVNYIKYADTAKQIADLMIERQKDSNTLQPDDIHGRPEHQQYYTYNQGIFLEGFVRVYQLTGDARYLDKAKNSIRRTISQMTDPSTGMLLEPFRTDMFNMDQPFFRGIFYYYLSHFLERIDLSSDPDFTRAVYKFLRTNADLVATKCNIANEYEPRSNYDSCSVEPVTFVTSDTSTTVTKAASIQLKMTYLRMRTWLAAHPEIGDIDYKVNSTQYKCNTSNKLRFVADTAEAKSQIKGVYMVDTNKFYDINNMHDVDAPNLCKYAGDGVVRKYAIEVVYNNDERKSFNLGSYTWDNKDSKTNISLTKQNDFAINLSTNGDQEYSMNNTTYRLDGGGYNRTPKDGKAGVFVHLR